MNEELERKLKRERVEACLNCKKFVECDSIGKFEECADCMHAYLSRPGARFARYLNTVYISPKPTRKRCARANFNKPCTKE